MKTLKRSRLAFWAGALGLSCGALLLAPYLFDGKKDAVQRPELSEGEKQALGLMTSLPIYWSEGDAFAALGSEEPAQLPWVRSALENRYRITPLDILASGESGNDPLAGLQKLAIIQPRGISPAGNAALDEWVRGGGRLLYLIDPMLSGEYEPTLGDPRHPTVTALVPPVITRWGLTLSFDEDQTEEPYLAQWDELPLPVVMGGKLEILPASQPESDAAAMGQCDIHADGIVASCAVGEGSVTLIADAALLEPREGNAQAEEAVIAIFSKALD